MTRAEKIAAAKVEWDRLDALESAAFRNYMNAIETAVDDE